MRWSNKLYNLHLNMAPSKAKDDAKSTKSSIRSTTSSLTKTAANGFNKLKHRATKLLSPKKKAKATPKLTAPSGMSPRATASFARTGKGTVTFMHHQYTKTETKFVGLPIKMNQLTSEPEQKSFDGLRKVVVHLRLLRIEGF